MTMEENVIKALLKRLDLCEKYISNFGKINGNMTINRFIKIQAEIGMLLSLCANYEGDALLLDDPILDRIKRVLDIE